MPTYIKRSNWKWRIAKKSKSLIFFDFFAIFFGKLQFFACKFKKFCFIFTETKSILQLKMGDYENKEREEVFSKKVRAGKRTYFFDVKATRSGDYYLTITESKKRLEDGVFVKHKIFLYKEDFEKFTEGLNSTVDYVKNNQEVVEKRYEFTESNDTLSKLDDDFSF